jgi:peptide/nickel transport system substrate-binding protein
MKERGKLTRREFLQVSALTTAGLAITACRAPATPAPATEAPKVEPTAKPAEPTAKPAEPTAVAKPAEPTATPEPVARYHEAPQLEELVKAGKLPPVDERLPLEPVVHTPVEEVGQYGGTWHRAAVGAGDVQMTARLPYENWVRWDSMGAMLVPNLMKAWDVSADGTVFTFYLRQGMKWSDGEPFTADDILFMFDDHWGNAEISTNGVPSWLKVKGEPVKAEKVDDYTVRLTFPGPNGLFMTLLASANGLYFFRCAHYAKQFHVHYVEDKAKLEADAKAAGFEFWYQYYNNKTDPGSRVRDELDLPTIYAWKVKVTPPTTPTVFERNPYYWKVDTAGNQLPYIDFIEHQLVENAEIVNLKAIAGELDMQLRHINFANYPLFQDSKAQGNYRVLQWIRGYITDTVVAPNIAHKDPVMREILGDKRFRWALSHGINREEIIESVYLGMAEPNQVSPLASSPFYWEEQAKNRLEYDVDLANSLLDEIGLTNKDAEGYRLRPDGKRLVINYEYAPVFGAWGDIGELLTAQWKLLGIQLVVTQEERTLFYERKQANEHDMGVWTGNGEFNPLIGPRWFLPENNESVHCVPFADWFNTDGKEGEEPPAGSDIRKTREIYEEIKVTVDPDKQKELWRQILELNKENLFVLGIATAPPELVIVKNNFRNVPEVAVSDWNLLTPGATAPEQYFIRQ